MAITFNKFLGTVFPAAQISECQITVFDATTTYKLTVGGITVSAIGNTDVNTTATDLAAAWNNSLHPYFTLVTASTSTDKVILTSDLAGLPFTAVSSVTGGTGTISAVSDTTANASPHDVGDANNWETGALPAVSANVLINRDVHLAWGLDAITNDIALLKITKNKARIGLRRDALAISADGQTVNVAVVEYRKHYLEVQLEASSEVRIGEHVGPGVPTGSDRIKIDFLETLVCMVHIFGSAPTSVEKELPVIRLLAKPAASATLSVVVHTGSCPAGAGLAVDGGGEEVVVDEIIIDTTSPQDQFFTNGDITFKKWTQNGGTCKLVNEGSGSGIVDFEINGGTLITEGNWHQNTVTGDTTVNGGVVSFEHRDYSLDEMKVMTINGGHVKCLTPLDANQKSKRIWGTVNFNGGTLEYDPKWLTITTLALQANDEFKLQYA